MIQTHEVDLCNAAGVRSVADKVAAEFDTIDILVHCAGVLAPIVPLLQADPATFLDGYKTTVVGTLVVAQAVIMANKNANPDDESREITFINLTTAGILFPPFPGMGAYVSSKMAAVKLFGGLCGRESLRAPSQCSSRISRHCHVYPIIADPEIAFPV